MQTVWDRLARNCIPCLGQTCAKLYTLFRTERTKTIHCLAAHLRIGHITGSTPPVLSGLRSPQVSEPQTDKNARQGQNNAARNAKFLPNASCVRYNKFTNTPKIGTFSVNLQLSEQNLTRILFKKLLKMN